MIRSVRTVNRTLGTPIMAFVLARGLKEGTGGRGMDSLVCNGIVEFSSTKHR
jgi:hypothetical protein